METSFSFTMIWSLYLSISGQAILSAFGLFRLAETGYVPCNIAEIQLDDTIIIRLTNN